MLPEPHYLTYAKWPDWAKHFHRLVLEAEAKEDPVRVSDMLRPIYNEVKLAIAEDRVPRKTLMWQGGRPKSRRAAIPEEEPNESQA